MPQESRQRNQGPGQGESRRDDRGQGKAVGSHSRHAPRDQRKERESSPKTSRGSGSQGQKPLNHRPFSVLKDLKLK